MSTPCRAEGGAGLLQVKRCRPHPLDGWCGSAPSADCRVQSIHDLKPNTLRNMADISTWIATITQNLIATLIAMAIANWLSANRESIQRVAGAAMSAGKKMTPRTLRTTLDVLVMWFLITQLRSAIEDPAPLTRMAVFEIAAWTWWLMFLAFDIAFKPCAQRRR